jgi:hypothetical protein
MQIHELTRKKSTELEEGISADIGGAAGGAINVAKNVGSAIASPFKDVAQGYKSARQDQKVSAMADKAFRVWQSYVAQVEQSIAKQPAPAIAPAKDDPKDPLDNPPTGGAEAAATKDAVAPGATTPPPTNGATTPPETTTTQGTDVDLAKAAADKLAKGQADQTATVQALKARQLGQFAPGSTSATTPAKPNYGAQTGAGANVTYKQPAGVPNPLANKMQPTSPNMVQPATPPPATVGSVADGQSITVGGQKLRPGTKEYDALSKATLKELQAPVAKTALDAFRDRSDGKYEQYLTAFVQKNLLAGMGFKGLVNQGEISNAIKAIAAPANADAAKQRPLWNDLVRACALAMPSQGALTGRTGGKDKDPNATSAPGEEKPGEEKPGEEKPAAPTMTKDQISQWITRNSEDHAALSALLAAINSAGKA